MSSLFKSDLFTKSVIKYIINPDNEFKPNKVFSISNSIFKYSKKADDDQIDIKDANAMGDYLEDPEPNPIKNPIVYIYISNQLWLILETRSLHKPKKDKVDLDDGPEEIKIKGVNC